MFAVIKAQAGLILLIDQPVVTKTHPPEESSSTKFGPAPTVREQLVVLVKKIKSGGLVIG